ncbi:helix-turn-helix domain-containing protein [Chitinophaga sp.]|uniref:helix-turn-helix domain-containing protein n=1 Tax=Chitinophaga sp. TaxID=1869181 RepID=UPI002F948A40
MADHYEVGIAIDRLQLSKSEEAALNATDEAKLAHREDRHSFFLLESGTVIIEIDFQKVEIKSPSVVYMHPDQVHRILRLKNMTVTSWAINNESLHPEYLKLLESLTPAKPLMLDRETFSIISAAAALCMKFSDRKSEKLYPSILKDSCNALVALVISQYLASATSINKISRYKLIADAFKSALESNFTNIKSPAAYAQQLNISPPYLNECVKNATGYSVSHHIQQRIILEAKRLLYHSNKSIKEISAALGYDDYPYFSKFFTKTTGMSPLAFRNKNLE